MVAGGGGSAVVLSNGTSRWACKLGQSLGKTGKRVTSRETSNFTVIVIVSYPNTFQKGDKCHPFLDYSCVCL